MYGSLTDIVLVYKLLLFLYAIRSVSYTHLDVYKRQQLLRFRYRSGIQKAIVILLKKMEVTHIYYFKKTSVLFRIITVLLKFRYLFSYPYHARELAV